MQRRPVVLAVDDKPANLLAIEAVLGTKYHVVRATSGRDAIQLVTSRDDIDIVLMDVQMPLMDGFETAAKIKEIDTARDLPIVFITAVYPEDPDVRRAYEAGAIDYFSKPFDPEILKLKVGIYANFRQRSTMLKERERQVRVSEELLAVGQKLSSILDTLPLGVIIADLDGRICQINEAVSRILKSVESVQSDLYGEFLGWWNAGGRVIKEQSGPLSRALHGGKTSRNELMKIRCFDASEKTILCSASPLSKVDGQIVGGVLVIQDVTEPKTFANELQERITRLVSLRMELEEARSQHNDSTAAVGERM
jgi:CheY-like chemotaxis protein